MTKIPVISKSEFKYIHNHQETYIQVFKIMNAFPGYKRAVMVIPKDDMNIITSLANSNGYVVTKDDVLNIATLSRGGYVDGHKPTRPVQNIVVMTDECDEQVFDIGFYTYFSSAYYDNLPGQVVLTNIKKESSAWLKAHELLYESDIYFNKLK